MLLLMVSSFVSNTTGDITTSSNFVPTASFNSTVATVAIKSPNPLTLADLHRSGLFLFPVSAIFVLVNGFLMGIVAKDWERISDSVYYNSTLFCMMLTSSDFTFSLLLGLPIGIRLTFEELLRKNKSLVYYTEDIGYVLFEYLYIHRVILVAVISADKCFHILRPFKYMMIATKGRVNIVGWIIIILPLLRIAPMMYVLKSTENIVHCSYYNDDATDEQYYHPLTCMIDSITTLPGFNTANISIMGALVGVSWVTILVSNIFILVIVVDKSFVGYFTRQSRLEVTLKLLKNSIVVLLIASTFALTNFPFAYAWTTHLFVEEKNYRQHLYLILLTFMSLFFHPWLYCLRMRNIQDLVTGFGNRVRSLISTPNSSRKSALTKTITMSPVLTQSPRQYRHMDTKKARIN